MAYVIKNASESEENFDSFLHSKFEALFVALFERHLNAFLNGRKNFDIDLFIQQKRKKTGKIGKRSKSIEHMVGYAYVKVIFFAAC